MDTPASDQQQEHEEQPIDLGKLARQIAECLARLDQMEIRTYHLEQRERQIDE